jgi:predicted permease
MFVKLYTTAINLDLLKVLMCGILLLIANDIIGQIIAKLAKYDIGLTNAFKNSIMFNNSGNIGVPLVTLIFTGEFYVVDGKTPYLDTAIAALIVILLLQNVGANTLGLYNAGRARLTAKDSIMQILAMPSIYVLPIVLLLKGMQIDITSTVLWPVLEYLKDGLVPMVLVTLGVQLSRTTFDFTNVDVYIAVFTKLIIGPIIAMIFIYLWGFYGVIAQTILIAYAAPTAVNSALIAIECDNYPDFSSQTVMLSTVFSAVTLTFVIYAARIIFPV